MRSPMIVERITGSSEALRHAAKSKPLIRSADLDAARRLVRAAVDFEPATVAVPAGPRALVASGPVAGVETGAGVAGGMAAS